MPNWGLPILSTGFLLIFILFLAFLFFPFEFFAIFRLILEVIKLSLAFDLFHLSQMVSSLFTRELIHFFTKFLLPPAFYLDFLTTNLFLFDLTIFLAFCPFPCQHFCFYSHFFRFIYSGSAQNFQAFQHFFFLFLFQRCLF